MKNQNETNDAAQSKKKAGNEKAQQKSGTHKHGSAAASGVDKGQGTSQAGKSGGNLGGNQGGPRGGAGKGSGAGKRA